MKKQNVYVCRCEDVTLDELYYWIHRGFTTFEGLKRQLRIGMGPCQGQICGEVIRRELANFLKKHPADINTHTTRPLTMGVPLEAIAKAGDQDES